MYIYKNKTKQKQKLSILILSSNNMYTEMRTKMRTEIT